MYIVFTTILLLLIGDEHIEQLLYILLMMKKGLLLKKCECDEVRMCSSKKISFIRKNIPLFLIAPPPFYRRRSSSLHLKNFEHVWSTKY